MKVSELANRAGIAPSAVRFYEEMGVIPPASRRPNGYRDYGAEQLAQLRLVVALRRLGLAPVDAGRLAALCMERGEVDLDLAPLIAGQRVAIERQRADLERLDSELTDLELTIAAAGRARPTPARPNSPACSPRPAWTPTADPCATPAPPPTWPPSPPSNSSPRWCTPRPAAADQNTSANSSCSATAHPGSGTWPGNASPPPPRSSTSTTPASTCTTWLRTRAHPRPGPPGLADRPAGRPRRRRHPALTAAARDLPLTNIKAGEVDKALGYFETNAQRMRYARFRELGMFVGSGAVEAGCKAIIGQRLKLSGMRWSERGADAIAALRCHDASGQWAEICTETIRDCYQG